MTTLSVHLSARVSFCQSSVCPSFVLLSVVRLSVIHLSVVRLSVYLYARISVRLHRVTTVSLVKSQSKRCVLLSMFQKP